jgi:hypothetical protein
MELERNKTTKVGVFSLVNDAHAAAESFYDAVVGDRQADHGATPWYAGDRGKSMSANELTDPVEVSWRKFTPETRRQGYKRKRLFR